MVTSSLLPRTRRTLLCTWSLLAIQAFTPIALALSPVMQARAETHRDPFSADSASGSPLTEVTAVRTVQYTLKKGETVATVAKQSGLSLNELKTLNEFRTFAHGFEHLKAGDELDIPAHPLSRAPGAPHEDKKITATNGKAAASNGQQIAGAASQVGSFITSHGNGREAAEMAKGMAKGMAMGKANQTVQDWICQFGTAQVQLAVDDDLSLKNSSFSLLHPWYDTPSDMVFSQTGIHRTDDRTQTNIGAGYRHFRPSDMIGANTFVDYDLSRDHARAGLGAEYWRDNLKLSANAYVGLTGWKSSPDVDDYEERPANGWDLRAEGYLPAYPQLGAKLTYEQYYGNEVGLFGKEERQKNPHALTAGVNWTPFPLLTIGTSHRTGKGGEHDTCIEAEVNYRIGEPLGRQTDTGAVGALRSLAGSHYDLVDRNNDIVLEYRKQEVIQLSLPTRIEGRAHQTVSFTASIKAKHGLKDIVWDDAAFLAAGGKVTGKDTQWQLTLPAWQPKTINAWSVGAVAHDTRDNSSKRQEIQVVVTAPAVSTANSTMTMADAHLLADGQAHTQVTLTLQDENNNPVSGMADSLSLKGVLTPSATLVHNLSLAKGQVTTRPATQEPAFDKMKETDNGVYTATLTAGTVAGEYILSGMLDGKPLAQSKVMLDDTAADLTQSTLTSDKKTVLANGRDSAMLTITLLNNQHKPVTGETDRLALFVAGSGTDAASVTITPVSESAPGRYTATVSGTLAVSALEMGLNVHGKDSGKRVTLHFVAQKTALTMVKDGAKADGTDTDTVQATVQDEKGQPLNGVTVSFTTTDADLHITTASVTTDGNGMASTTLTSLKAGTWPVTATVEGTAVSVDAHFVADAATATLAAGAVTLDGTATTKVANGTDTFTYTARVTDAHGNAVPNVVVDWASDNTTTVKLSAASSTTNKEGKAVIVLASTVQEALDVQVSARVGAQPAVSADRKVSFKADITTATLNLSIENDGAVADGHAAVTLKVSAMDASMNPLEGADVTLQLPADIHAASQTVTLNALGMGAVALTSVKAGTWPVTGSVGGRTSAPVQVTFVAGPADVTRSALQAAPASIEANGTDHATLTLTLHDINNNPVSGQTVQFVSDLADTRLSAVTDHQDGSYSATLTGATPGQANLSVTVGGNAFAVPAARVALSTSLLVAITGRPVVGDILTATPTCQGGTCGTLTWQWQIENGVGSGVYGDIPGATSHTYTPVNGDQKRKIRVKVSE
ncbi:LysM peptidoglycan-binding domain-containing protein [Lelliottia aquatilis]|nr:inverse autotransporter beta domain-containing protein [Lelliottia aquatilis]NTZ47754.1 LysM peptidoglycan-binding domain-containing protein [Lelliottia aquatilis]